MTKAGHMGLIKILPCEKYVQHVLAYTTVFQAQDANVQVVRLLNSSHGFQKQVLAELPDRPTA